MIEHLSSSSIDTLLRCGKQWEWRYVYQIKRPPAGIMVLGTAFHHAVADNYNSMIDNQSAMTLKDILDSFDGAWEKQLKDHLIFEDEDSLPFDEIDWQDENPGKLKDDGYKLTEKYVTEIAPRITPLTIEEKKTTKIAGVDIVTITDLITPDKIIDHKTKAKRFSEQQIQSNLQPTVYSAVHPDKTFAYHIALRQKNPAVEETPAPRSQRDTDFLNQIIESVWKSIQAGVFIPNTSTWACSKDFCGYWDICRGKK